MKKPANLPVPLRGPRPFTRRAFAAGFTLVELLVTIAISGVLLMVGIPSMANMAASLELSSATNVFVAGLYLARGEAIKRNKRVVLCKTADAVFCTNDGGWEQGWILFQDSNNNGLRETTEEIIRRELPLPAKVKLMGNSNVASYVSFAPTGSTQLVTGGFQAGTLTVCRQSLSAGDAREIVLNATGRPRVQKVSVPSCL